MSKDQLYGIVKNAASYDNARKFLYIDGCEQCMHKRRGQENGGSIPVVGDFDENGVWYFCFHQDFTGWPKRIGQLAETKTVPYFCPLESLVKEEDLTPSIKREKAKKIKSDQVVTQILDQQDLLDQHKPNAGQQSSF